MDKHCQDKDIQTQVQIRVDETLLEEVPRECDRYNWWSRQNHSHTHRESQTCFPQTQANMEEQGTEKGDQAADIQQQCQCNAPI